MRRWGCSVTEISVYLTGISVTDGNFVFHMTTPTELQSTSSLKKCKLRIYYCLFFAFHWQNAFLDIQRGGGGRLSIKCSFRELYSLLKCDHYIKCLRFNQEEWKDLLKRKRKIYFSNPGHALMLRFRAAGLTLTLLQANVCALARIPPSLLAK